MLFAALPLRERPAPVPASTAATIAPPVIVPIPLPANPPAVRTYTVKPGDSLGGIAKRELGSPAAWEALWKANDRVLPNPSKLEVGMVLELPAR
jgi:nucleoid-associated protein YgaU